VQLSVFRPAPVLASLVGAARTGVRLAASVCVVGAVFLGAAWYAGTTPFGGAAYAPYSERGVVRALPFDAPLPYDQSLVEAGRGTDLPYHTRWESDLPPEEVAMQVADHLAKSPKWQLTQLTPLHGEFDTTFARQSADGYLTHFASMSVTAAGAGTVIVFDFTPVPTSLAPE
jgi:hypothetical protein